MEESTPKNRVSENDVHRYNRLVKEQGASVAKWDFAQRGLDPKEFAKIQAEIMALEHVALIAERTKGVRRVSGKRVVVHIERLQLPNDGWMDDSLVKPPQDQIAEISRPGIRVQIEAI